jgi:hypothetical protein
LGLALEGERDFAFGFGAALGLSLARRALGFWAAFLDFDFGASLGLRAPLTARAGLAAAPPLFDGLAMILLPAACQRLGVPPAAF